MSTIRFLADHDLNEHIVAGVHRLDPGSLANNLKTTSRFDEAQALH